MNNSKKIIIGIGSNIASKDSSSIMLLHQAIMNMQNDGILIEHKSAVYKSTPLTGKLSNTYFNSIISIATFLPPISLLVKLKQIEKKMGRRAGEKRWGDRNIDLDIISYKNLILNWGGNRRNAQTRKGKLILPHPQAHLREFVLRPLCDILPNWRHPILHKTALALLEDQKRAKKLSNGEIIDII